MEVLRQASGQVVSLRRSGKMLTSSTAIRIIVSYFLSHSAVSTRNQKLRDYIFSPTLSSSPILHPCWHPNNYFLLTHRIPQVTALFKLSQIFTREASSPPLSRFESSYRSVRATQPSCFSQSDGRPRISSSRHSTCDKNRDLLPSSPRDVSINPRPPRPPAPWRHCRVPLLLNVPATGLSERAFAVIARLVSTTSIFWRR
jgi:hypothetical protein